MGNATGSLSTPSISVSTCNLSFDHLSQHGCVVDLVARRVAVTFISLNSTRTKFHLAFTQGSFRRLLSASCVCPLLLNGHFMNVKLPPTYSTGSPNNDDHKTPNNS